MKKIPLYVFISFIIAYIAIAAPDAPTINSPANASTESDSPVLLNCSLGSDADGDSMFLRYYGNTSATSMALLGNCSANTNCTYEWTVVDSTTYYWTCGVYDLLDETNATDIRQFTTDFDTALTSDESHCLLYGTFVNGSECAIGEALKEEDTMIIANSLIYIFITALIGIGLYFSNTLWLKTILSIALSLMIMTLFRLSSWFVHISNPEEVELINTLDHFYMFGVWGFRLALIFGVFIVLIIILQGMTTVNKRKKDWDKFGKFGER